MESASCGSKPPENDNFWNLAIKKNPLINFLEQNSYNKIKQKTSGKMKEAATSS